jgi:hypothetical protein
MDNHMGAVTRVTYASSTEFYRADAERPETRHELRRVHPKRRECNINRIELVKAAY